MKASKMEKPPGATGIALDAVGYDLLMWLLHFGREYRFREDVLALAALAPGETVLDVGCGTGTLAIAAKRQLGPSGQVHGIDASAEMIALARAKAKKQHVDVTFEHAAAEVLPFPDAVFNIVLSTIMLHHLPRKGRLRAIEEIRRVLKPGGRAVIVDFQDSGKRHGFIAHFLSHRHGHVKIDDMRSLLDEAGLSVVESGPFRKPNLYYIVAACAAI